MEPLKRWTEVEILELPSGYKGQAKIGTKAFIWKLYSSGYLLSIDSSQESEEIVHNSKLIPEHYVMPVAKVRHPHADLMIQYANDINIKLQFSCSYFGEDWQDVKTPTFSMGSKYRIKPKEASVDTYKMLKGIEILIKDLYQQLEEVKKEIY